MTPHSTRTDRKVLWATLTCPLTVVGGSNGSTAVGYAPAPTPKTGRSRNRESPAFQIDVRLFKVPFVSSVGNVCRRCRAGAGASFTSESAIRPINTMLVIRCGHVERFHIHAA